MRDLLRLNTRHFLPRCGSGQNLYPSEHRRGHRHTYDSGESLLLWSWVLRQCVGVSRVLNWVSNVVSKETYCFFFDTLLNVKLFLLGFMLISKTTHVLFFFTIKRLLRIALSPIINYFFNVCHQGGIGRNQSERLQTQWTTIGVRFL